MTEDERTATQELNKLYPPQITEVFRKKFMEERNSGLGVVKCFNRVCPRHDPERGRAGAKMMACTPCNKIGLRVTYCSK